MKNNLDRSNKDSGNDTIQHCFEYIFKYSKASNYKTALKDCLATIESLKDAWIYCVEAELYAAIDEYKIALGAYTKAFAVSSSNRLLDTYISLQLAIFHLEKDNPTKVISTLDDYFYFYPTQNTKELTETYLHYHIYLIVLLEQNEIHKAKRILNSLETFACTELQYLKIAMGFAKNEQGTADVYLSYMDSRPIHAANRYSTPNETNIFDNDFDPKTYFQNCFEEELQCTKLLYIKTKEVRNDVFFKSNHDRHSILMKIKPEYSQVIIKRLRLLSPPMGRVVRILNSRSNFHQSRNLDKDCTYIEINYTAEKWFGDMKYLSQTIYWLGNYVEDIEILTNEMYENWVDHFQVQNGRANYRRYWCNDDFLESKLKTYEEIVRKNPNNIELKKMISSEFHTYGREDNLKIELLKTDKDAYQSSITRLIKSLQYNPENVEALISYGEILFYKSNLPLSKEQFQTALNINKALPEAHYYLGKIYMAENNIPLAEASFIRLLGILSKHAKIRAKKIDALKTLRMLAKEKPKTLKTTLKTIEEQLSLLYFESNKVNLEYNTNYNNSSYMKEKFKAAVKSSEEKIENEPTSAAHWIKLGSNFYHLKNMVNPQKPLKKPLNSILPDGWRLPNGNA